MRKGVTLIELLVSSLILVIGITALMWSFVECKQIIQRNTHKCNATTIVNQWFEGIQRRPDSLQVADYIGPYTGGAYKTIVKKVDNGIPHDYFIEFDNSTILNPTGMGSITLVTARVSWDTYYVPKNSPNSLFMAMYTNDPY